MSWFYLAYGLGLSSDLQIPALVSVEKSDKDVAVYFTRSSIFDEVKDETTEPFYPAASEAQSYAPTLKAWRLADNFGFRLEYRDGIQFIVTRSGDRVWCRWPPSMTLDDVAVYLMGPVLGFMLRLRGRICLHASVVCIDDQAVAFVGPGRSGKSTTAAALLKLGWPILTDDVAAITIEDCSFLVEPAYPHVRLWPNSVNILYGDEEALPRLVPVGDWDKCYLNLANKPESFQTTPVSLRAVYVLENRVHGDVAGSITSLSPAAAMIALVANTYANKLINRSLRSEEFQVLTSLVGSIPIKKIIPNSNPTLLPDLCESIIKDFRQSATDAGRVAAVGS